MNTIKIERKLSVAQVHMAGLRNLISKYAGITITEKAPGENYYQGKQQASCLATYIVRNNPDQICIS